MHARGLRRLARAVAMLALMGGAALPIPAARAQDEGLAGSYITPFPDKDIYRIQVVGDWWADAMIEGLFEGLGRDPGIQLNRKHRPIPTLFRSELDEDLRGLDEQLAKEPAHIVVVMLGANDRIAYRATGAGNRRVAVGSEEWRVEYARRIDRVMKLLKARRAAVYWVSQPPLRRPEANEDAQMMNEIIRERAYLNGLKFVDVFASFGDEQGEYTPYGPDLSGKIRLLRDQDGIGFTGAGGMKLAHFVEREIKRDLTQAKGERAIPLAGSEEEQARIAPRKDAPQVAAGAGAPGVAAPVRAALAPGGAAAVAGGAASQAEPIGDQKAENGRISIRTAGAGGREEIVTLEILRPAIPASIVAMVTRRDGDGKPTAMGDVIMEDLPGGLSLMAAITPATGIAAGRGKLPPTQAAYFRVLVKGERLQPKPGRADDFSWPRPTADVAAPEPAEPAARTAPRRPPPRG